MIVAKQKWNNRILVLWEGRLVDKGGGQEITDEDWACVRTEYHNRSKLSSLVPDTFSATFDNSNGSNESVCGADNKKEVSFEDRRDNDLIQNTVQAKEMAREVIQIESARAESFYINNKNVSCTFIHQSEIMCFRPQLLFIHIFAPTPAHALLLLARHRVLHHRSCCCAKRE
jgi:hypothetical protein